ncbi:MAG: GAK system XXXCH domain-containing protein [Thermodesulfobacteriota bacterium]
MADKTPKNALRQELAAHLEALAQRLRQGEAGEDINLAPGIEAYVHIKEKKGRLAAKVSIKWLPPAYATPDLVPCKDEGLQQLASFKEVKKRLNGLFRELQKIASRGNFPEETKLQDFMAISREFNRFAEPEWQTEMQVYLDHVANLELAWKNRQLEMWQHELQDLQKQMMTCHREYK